MRPRLAPTGPNQDPLGKRVRLHLDTRGLSSSAKPAWTTIIGVIADARTESLADAAIPQIYRSVYQRTSKDLTIFLRGQLDPSTIPAQVREQVQSVDATLPVFHAETLDDVLSDLAFGQAILDGNGGVFCGHCLAARRAWNLRDYFLCCE